MRLTLLTLLFTTFLCTCVCAQKALTGTVIDAKTEAPLPYVYLKVKDYALGTVTEADGSYRLTVPAKLAGRTVVFSYLGYADLELTVRELRDLRAPVRLKEASTTLSEVTVTPKKLPSAKSILRRALNKVDDNYPTETHLHDGYYRETIKENGVYIKLADAAVTYRASAYGPKKYKWKKYESPYGWGTTLGGGGGDGLHRIHFEHKTLKTDDVFVLDARASENGTTRNMESNIIGGPLSLLGRDRVRFQESFLGKKRNKDFTYLVDEVKTDDGRWIYALHFKTTTTKAELEALKAHPKNKLKRMMWRHANKHKLLAGTIFVDPDNYAILGYNCHVPNELKPYFCGYTTMTIKHFDYKLDVRYKQLGGKYVIDYLRHEDEFIYKDTTDQTTTPYAAVSEFTRLGGSLVATGTNPEGDKFSNVEANRLYDFPLAYDSMFWVAYEARHPEMRISAAIRADMETKKPLEQQFGDKQKRDESMPAPIARIDPTKTEIHGVTLTDDYAWMKDAKAANANAPVMDHLRAENAYTENYYRPIRREQRNVHRFLTAQVTKDYTSPPTKTNGFYYHYEYRDDQEYPVYFRSPVSDTTRKDTLINVNTEAEKHEYYSVGGLRVSPDNSLMAYSENTDGSDRYVLRIRDLKTDKQLSDSLLNLSGLVWLDDATFLYTIQQPKTLRTWRVMRHRLGTPQSTDELVFQEDDPLYGVSIGKSKSKEFIWMTSSSSDANELSYLRTNDPAGKFKMLFSREDERRYGVNHHADQFFISVMDDKEVNGALYVADTSRMERKNWETVLPHRKEVMFQGLVIFDNYLVVSEKEEAATRLRIIDRRTGDDHYLKVKGNDLHSIGFGYNPDTDTDTLQYVYSSFTVPSLTINYHMGTKEEREVRRRKLFPNAKRNMKFAVKGIVTKREWATAKDGTRIPITVIYNKWANGGPKKDHGRVYLQAYGAYGAGNEPGYSSYIHSMILRGFTFAYAHVRGGNEMGMQWHKDGKMGKKMNTFTDYIACAEHLIEKGYAKKGTITAEGGSAGGLTMGAVVNMRPELFRAVIFNVPFVDVINTMLDDKLPLTTGEYLEWGNPNKKKEFKNMLAYSPYENVKAQAYPNMFFFTGLNDTRVGYWEPAKMVAKLRKLKTDDNILLLKTNLNAGHGGSAGRYAGLQDGAYKLALLFDLYAVEEDVK